MDLIVRNARLLDRDGAWEIAVADGRIAAIGRDDRRARGNRDRRREAISPRRLTSTATSISTSAISAT